MTKSLLYKYVYLLPLAALVPLQLNAQNLAPPEVTAPFKALVTDISVSPNPALSLQDLDAISAGTDTSQVLVATQQLSATNSGNSISADAVTSGSISFEPGALTGFSGIGNFVSNTGNNNNLQGTISVNILGVPLSQ